MKVVSVERAVESYVEPHIIIHFLSNIPPLIFQNNTNNCDCDSQLKSKHKQLKSNLKTYPSRSGVPKRNPFRGSQQRKPMKSHR